MDHNRRKNLAKKLESYLIIYYRTTTIVCFVKIVLIRKDVSRCNPNLKIQALNFMKENRDRFYYLACLTSMIMQYHIQFFDLK